MASDLVAAAATATVDADADAELWNWIKGSDGISYLL